MFQSFNKRTVLVVTLGLLSVGFVVRQCFIYPAGGAETDIDTPSVPIVHLRDGASATDSGVASELEQAVKRRFVSRGLSETLSTAISENVHAVFRNILDGDFASMHESMVRNGLVLDDSARGVLQVWGADAYSDVPSELWEHEDALAMFQYMAARPAERYAAINSVGVNRVTSGFGLATPAETHGGRMRSKISMYRPSGVNVDQMNSLLSQAAFNGEADDEGDSDRPRGVWIMLPVRFHDGESVLLRLTYVVDEPNALWFPYRIDYIGQHVHPKRLLF